MLIQAHLPPTEKELSADLETRLDTLKRDGRCDWRKEVRMLCFGHASQGGTKTLRVDYAAKLDGILIGFEVKAPPDRPADLGRDLFQCAQYSQSIVGAATADRVPPEWVGQAFLATFYVSDSRFCSDNTRAHGDHAQRLFGPANVGFTKKICRHEDAFELFLCADRAWSKEWGWHRGLVNKTARIGNGSVRVVDTSEFVIPEEWRGSKPVEGVDYSL